MIKDDRDRDIRVSGFISEPTQKLTWVFVNWAGFGIQLSPENARLLGERLLEIVGPPEDQNDINIPSSTGQQRSSTGQETVKNADQTR